MNPPLPAEPPAQERANARLLRTEEKALLRALLQNQRDSQRFERQIDCGQVFDLEDGGMGSLRFSSETTRHLGRLLAEAQYIDTDGELVSIVANADQDGDLFELDFWKVDFSALERYPRPEELRIIGE